LPPLSSWASGLKNRSTHSTVIAWERLTTVDDDSDAAPELRCYHPATLVQGVRISTLHAFLATHTWHEPADTPAQPCGGTAIAAVSLSSCSEYVLIHLGGHRTGHSPHEIYTPSTDTWSTVCPPPIPNAASGARSVHGLVPFVTRTNTTPERITATSSVGHAGAGIFWDDAWLLVVTSTSTPSLEWKSLRVEGSI
ncbi:hypothetical protein EV363DRAFT_1172301, partial [Boletus edulis]